METTFTARATTNIKVPVSVVWDALINAETIKKYMFGTKVVSKWKEGSPIVWKGVWNGRPYEDKGVIMTMQPDKKLEYTHFSALAGQPDRPENYHTMTFDLTTQGTHTHVSLSQDNNPDEKAAEHSQKMWEGMLLGLKKLLETSEIVTRP